MYIPTHIHIYVYVECIHHPEMDFSSNCKMRVVNKVDESKRNLGDRQTMSCSQTATESDVCKLVGMYLYDTYEEEKCNFKVMSLILITKKCIGMLVCSASTGSMHMKVITKKNFH